MTAVEFLEDKLNQIKSSSTDINGTIKFLETEFKELFEQAKEMEKQQQGYSEEDMKHAFLSGCQSERQIKQRVKCCEEFIEKFKKK